MNAFQSISVPAIDYLAGGTGIVAKINAADSKKVAGTFSRS
jgi:hypothetical protein